MKSKNINVLSRRKSIKLLGLGTFALHFPFNLLQGQSKLEDLTSQKLHFYTMTEIGELIRSRKITSLELTQIMLNRVESIDPKLNSYITITKKEALSRANLLDKELKEGKYRGFLHGVPIAVKDLIYTKGIRTTGGTLVNDTVPDFDATVVRKLLDAGAVILGKLSTSEGAWSAHHPAFKAPKNPWNDKYYTGVSSSGPGVATAAGLCFASLGTDTGGSIAYPSSANGIVGFKPTFGRVSRYGVLPMALSLDHVGPMARCVKDVAMMFQVIAGPDSMDSESINAPIPNILDLLDGNIEGMRIGFDPKYASENVEGQVKEATQSVLNVLESLGAEIVKVEMPDLSQLRPAWDYITLSELRAIHAKTFPSLSKNYGPSFRQVMENSLKVTEVELANALKIRDEITVEFNRLLSSVDAFVCPVMWCAPGKYLEADVLGGHRPIDPSPWKFDKFTKAVNFNGSPSLTVPCGLSNKGLPIGIQFIGKHLSEEIICRIGYAYEQKTEWHKKHPNI